MTTAVHKFVYARMDNFTSMAWLKPMRKYVKYSSIDACGSGFERESKSVIGSDDDIYHSTPISWW